jgi:prickle
VPKLGTPGEKWRERALMYQMPKQDISESYCKYLSGDLAKRRYKEFIKERNTKALDIGMCFANMNSELVER